jgi:hypothetical protein
MAERILGPTGSARRKRFLVVPFLIVACTALFLIGSAQAVHDLEFQLDGNALSTVCGTTPDGNCTTQVFDWGRTGTTNTHYIFNADRSVNTSVVNSANSTGFTSAAFQRDFGVKVSAQDNCNLTNTTSTTFCTADTTTFATGSKDTQNISGGGADQAGNWQCNKDNNVNSKIDITNAYSAGYTAPNGDRILYFALEKNKDNGNNNAGFWFLQGDANCVSTGSAVNFTGNHRNGDILVTSAFTSGGGVSSILVFRWAGAANGCIDSDPTAAPACDQQPIGSGGDCKTAPTTPPPAPVDTICGTTNSGTLPTNTNISVPWLTADATLGVGTTVVPPDFFEGAINISKAFRDAPGGGSAPTCFNTFIADTRSSTSPPATLFDFARGVLGQCSSTTTTTPVDAADNTASPASTIPADPADAKVDVKDKTVITVNGVASFSGSISWHICGPTDPSSSTLCSTGGVDLGSQNITTAGTYYSPTATVTSAGRYCFRAEFSGDSTAGVPGSSDSRANECFTVAPRQPALTTDATDGPIDFGLPISDSVSLSGTAHKPGTGGPTGSNGTINPTTLGGDATGNIIVKAYGPDSCSTVAFTSNAIAASGDGTYGGAGSAFQFTPTAPGQYIFVASYAGDSPNTLGIAESACSAAPDAEKVTVRQIPTAIATSQRAYPADSATITSSVATDNLGAGGTVQFRLFNSLADCTAGAAAQTVGQGGLLYKESKTLNGGANSETVSTANTTVSITANATVYWRVTYSPAAGDSAHTGRQSACVENTALTFVNETGPGTLFP